MFFFREINCLFTFFKFLPNAPPGYIHCCPEDQIRSSIEQSHANLQNQQHHLKSQVCLHFFFREINCLFTFFREINCLFTFFREINCLFTFLFLLP